MKIGFLADKIPYPARRGWGVYSYQLLRALLQVDESNRYHCFYNSFRQPGRKYMVSGDPARLHNHVWRLPGRVMDLLWDRWRLLPAELFVGDVDVLHVPYELLPPVRSAKTVVTVHDVTFLLHPELLDEDFVERHRRRIERIVAHADRVVAVSHNTRAELIATTGIEPQRVTVVTEGVDEHFRVPESTEEVSRCLERLGVRRPYVLFVGAADADKNLARLAAAFTRLRQDVADLSLVLAGRDEWGYARLMEQLRADGHSEGVLCTGYVDAADLPLLYNGARALVLPSLHEGFGLPALEAMACGTAVLAANVASLPEVVGDAGVLVDPYEVDAIEAGLRDLVCDDALRAACVARGLERAAGFSWRDTARQMLAIYQELAW